MVLVVATEVDVGIVIALREEMTYFAAELGVDLRPSTDSETGDIYYRFEVPSAGGLAACVAVVTGDMGPTHSALQTGKLLALFRPRIIVSIGIAGALASDLELGDVVVATTVDHYIESAKAGDVAGSVDLHFAGEVYRCNRLLINAARNLSYTHPGLVSKWAEHAASTLPNGTRPPTVHDGPIASAPVVVASLTFTASLVRRNRKYLAVEMESAGILAAVEETGATTRALVIRGISDRADPAKSTLDVQSGDVTGKQQCATRRAIFSH